MRIDLFKSSNYNVSQCTFADPTLCLPEELSQCDTSQCRTIFATPTLCLPEERLFLKYLWDKSRALHRARASLCDLTKLQQRQCAVSSPSDIPVALASLHGVAFLLTVLPRSNLQLEPLPPSTPTPVTEVPVGAPFTNNLSAHRSMKMRESM